MADLKKLRDEIDTVDKKIVELFEKRMEIVSNVTKYKIINNTPVLNSLRESEIIDKNLSYLRDRELNPYLSKLYSEIIKLSKTYQKDQINKNKSYKKICYQGTHGSYSQQALYEYFGSNVIAYPVDEFEDVFKNLSDKKIDYGILPIENSSTGPISEVYDLLRKYGLFIVGNMTIKIEHNLMAIREADLRDIKTVYSHPQALLQCSEFLKDKGFDLKPHSNTALSAALVRESGSKNIGAIGSKKAAVLNDLKIIKANINNTKDNFTRFIIIGKKIETGESNDSISIVFSSPNKVGLLYDSLEIFKRHNINMTRIESRPIIGKPWEYFFYIDFEGDISNLPTKEVLDYIKGHSTYFKLLGTYKK